MVWLSVRRNSSTDGTPCAVKIARTVWSGGKAGDNFKGLPITIIQHHSGFCAGSRDKGSAELRRDGI